MQLDYQKNKLKNGIRVITVPMKNTAAVTSLILVGVGSHYETKSMAGISHYLEHLVFKGSKKYPTAHEISIRLDGLGALYNAVTTNEYTGFYATTVADKVEIGFDIMADYLKNPLFKPAEVQREKGPILEEIRADKDSPASDVWNIFFKTLYGDQPAGRDIAGTEESVLGIKRKDIKNFFDEYYRGGNIVLIFAGNITHNRGLNLARKFLGNVKDGTRLEKQSVIGPKNVKNKVTIKTKNTKQTHMVLGFEGLNNKDKRVHAEVVLARLLGSGLSSRLFTEVREKRGLAYSIGANTYGGSDFGYFVVPAGITSEKLPVALRVIIKELKKIKKEPVSKQELKRIKDRIEGLEVLAMESSKSVAFDFGSDELILDRIETPLERIEKIKKVKASEVQSIANDTFKKNTMRLALIGPHKNKKELEEIINKI